MTGAYGGFRVSVAGGERLDIILGYFHVVRHDECDIRPSGCLCGLGFYENCTAKPVRTRRRFYFRFRLAETKTY